MSWSSISQTGWMSVTTNCGHLRSWLACIKPFVIRACKGSMAHELTTGIQVELAQQAHEAGLPLYTGAQDQGLDEHAERG